MNNVKRDKRSKKHNTRMMILSPQGVTVGDCQDRQRPK